MAARARLILFFAATINSTITANIATQYVSDAHSVLQITQPHPQPL
jgi:hypothetical protein